MGTAMQSSPFPGLSDALYQWIARATGAELAAFRGRAGGGASREGAQLELAYPDGRRDPCYLTWDLRAAGASDRLSGFAAEASAIAAVYAASQKNPNGMQVPRVIAWDAGLRAMLTALVPGEALFTRLRDPAERERVAFDFMRQLAALHALDVASLPLQGFPSVAPVSTYLMPRIAALAAKHAGHPEDPLLVFALRWLADHLPADPPRTVLVHGDAGPANFLYHDGKCTAVLDWEMTHFGDPMEDLAWIAIRDLFQPFVALPQCFAEYARASGAPVDLPRVRWYRTYALMTLAVDGYHDRYHAQGPYNGVLGNNLLYGTSHRRALIDGLAECEHIAVPRIELPDCPRGPDERSFEIVQDEIRNLILPRIDDAPTAARVKALARVVKFWQANARYGAACDAMTVAELSAALGQTFAHVAEARAAFVQAIRARTLADAAIIRLLHRQAQREVALMAPAMGSLAARSFSPLE